MNDNDREKIEIIGSGEMSGNKKDCQMNHQRMLEFQLWEEHNVPVVQMSLMKAHTQLKLDGNNGSLYILNNDGSIMHEVSLVYYRADGDDGIEWKARDTIERSKATKCPSLGYHLAGTKKSLTGIS